MIKKVPINDNWLYRKGFTQDSLERDFDWSDSFIVQLPHNVNCHNSNYYNSGDMRTLSTYSRVFTVPDSYNGKRLLLNMEGVLSYVEVYVNGIFVTSHKGEAPFVADITAPVKFNFENRIVLKVDSQIRDDEGAGNRGPLTVFGGVCRDVVFMICDGRDIRDVCVRSGYDGTEYTVTADVELFDYYPDTELEGEILDGRGKTVCRLATRSVQGSSVRLKGELTEAECWSPDSPVMYTASVRLKSGNKLLDCKKTEFGFCSAVFRRDGFYLNGKPLKLIGLLRSDSYPMIGRSGTGETERRDARLIKNAGCNAVRTMGQASRDFIDECNRIGLLVIEDVYGDGYIGDVKWRESFIENVTDMVIRDRNNPSIIAWGIRVNNSADCDELYFKVNKAVKEADPTRATLGARSFKTSRVYEDVFAYNETVSSKRGRRKSGKLFVPYVIGEHGGVNCPAKMNDGENVRLYQAIEHLNAINDTLGGAALGAFGMSFTDFACGRYSGSGDNISHYGVFDGYRNPKLAAYAYISQNDDEPVMELSSKLGKDEFCGKLYIFTNADSVVMYRNGEKAGEFFPDRKGWQHVKHPPMVIDDFCGNLPSLDTGEGFKLKLFKSVLNESEKKGLLNLGFAGTQKSYILRKLLRLDRQSYAELMEKYSRIPPKGVTYRFEGIYDGEAKIVRTLTPEIKKTLSIENSCSSGVLKCRKSYERIAFSLYAHDGNGNSLDYCGMPVTVRASGSLTVEGSGHFALTGGKGGFFVRSISPGPGRVTVTSELGTQVYDFICEYADIERF